MGTDPTGRNPPFQTRKTRVIPVRLSPSACMCAFRSISPDHSAQACLLKAAGAWSQPRSAIPLVASPAVQPSSLGAGWYGRFGGRFVSETLIHALDELTEAATRIVPSDE